MKRQLKKKALEYQNWYYDFVYPSMPKSLLAYTLYTEDPKERKTQVDKLTQYHYDIYKSARGDVPAKLLKERSFEIMIRSACDKYFCDHYHNHFNLKEAFSSVHGLGYKTSSKIEWILRDYLHKRINPTDVLLDKPAEFLKLINARVLEQNTKSNKRYIYQSEAPLSKAAFKNFREWWFS